MNVHRWMQITRRQLLAAGAAASAHAVPRLARAEAPAATEQMALTYAPGRTTPIALAGVPRGAAPDAVAKAVRQAACGPDDLAWLSRGDTVFIKVAANSGNAYPATTDPVAVRAMVELVLERGAARVIVGDMSGVQFVRFWKDGLKGSSRLLMEENGIARAVRDSGAQLVAFEEAGWDGFFEERPTVAGTWAGPVMLPNVLKKVDHVVLMPRCSRHVLAGSTLALKSAVGWWRHDARLEYHRDAGTFSEKTADANTVPTILAKQRLVLTSGTRVLTTFGPDDGYELEPDTGIVFASSSAVAHDMLSLAWLLEGRRATPEGTRTGPLDDPNGWSAFVQVANRVVVAWLGGVGEALKMQRLERYDMDSIWDDRVLRRAFHGVGGVPRIDLAAVNDGVPASLRERLAKDLTPVAA